MVVGRAAVGLGRGPVGRLLACVGFAPFARATGTFGPCGQDLGGFTVDSVELDPALPRTSQDLSVLMVGRVLDKAAVLDTSSIAVTGSVFYCRRFEDCMPIFSHEATLCSLLNSSGGDCAGLKPGETFRATKVWKVPPIVLRGSYNLHIAFRDAGGRQIACYDVVTVEVLASSMLDRLHDLRDAIVAFLIAAAASQALGVHFPALSRRMLPRISGFLCIGILVGPYCTNLVSHMHIFLIGGFINKVSLAFVGGIAGAEIFLPEFRVLLAPLGLQILGISVFTLVIVTSGLLGLTSMGILDVPVISMQAGFAAKASVCMLAAALMCSLSPASTIAVISELKCGETNSAKMALGITVIGDVVVLILFSICCQVMRIVADGGGFGAEAMLETLSSIVASIALGVLAGQAMRLVLPVAEDSEEGSQESESSARKLGLGDAQAQNGQHHSAGGGEVAAAVSREAQGSGCAAVQEPIAMSHPMLRGLLVLAVLCGAFNLAQWSPELTGGHLHGEPLLACTVASCVCGHDKSRRDNLLEALSFWTPYVLMPFFTLAGASLDLPGLVRMFPAVVTLVALRMAGIATGSIWAGVTGRRILPSFRPTYATVYYTWATQVGQAGVTVGLVLEVCAQPVFKAWSRQFANLILGDVVINQMIGPMMCQASLRHIIKAEEEAHAAPGSQGEEQEEEEEDEESESKELPAASGGPSSQMLVPKAGAAGPPPGFRETRRPSVQPYDTLTRPL